MALLAMWVKMCVFAHCLKINFLPSKCRSFGRAKVTNQALINWHSRKCSDFDSNHFSIRLNLCSCITKLVTIM